MTPTWLTVLQIVLGSTVLVAAREIFGAWLRHRRDTSPTAVAAATIEESRQSLLVVAEARDILGQENKRLMDEVDRLRAEVMTLRARIELLERDARTSENASP